MLILNYMVHGGQELEHSTLSWDRAFNGIRSSRSDRTGLLTEYGHLEFNAVTFPILSLGRRRAVFKVRSVYPRHAKNFNSGSKKSKPKQRLLKV